MEVKFDNFKNNNFFSKSSAEQAEENFFVASAKEKDAIISSSEHLNGYDSNILEGVAYYELPDETLKIEHRIGILEQILSKIKNEMAVAEKFNDKTSMTELIDRKMKVEKELNYLNSKYAEAGLGAKLSMGVASAVNFTSGKKMNIFSKTGEFVSKKILAKVSKKFRENLNMKEALENLSNINSSVDELISMNVPYGEAKKRYEKLTNYLKFANSIHSQISNNLKSSKG